MIHISAPLTVGRALLLATVLTGAPSAAMQDSAPIPTAQEVAPEPGAVEVEAEPAPDLLAPPASVEAALAIELSDLEAAVEERDASELTAALATWMALVERQHAAYSAAAAAEEGSEERAGAASQGTDRDTLIGQAEVLIAAVAGAGGEVAEARASIATIRETEREELDTASTLPTDQTQAQDLDVEVLRASLRPLTKDQVAEQLEAWLALLQEKCIEVRKVEVAALESEDAAEIDKYNERAVESRGERGRLIQRVKVVIDSLEAKNGDVADARAYVDSVVVSPPISGWQAALTTTRAWITSPDGGIDLGLRLLRALGVVVVFWLLSHLAARIARRAVRSMRKASELLRTFAVGATRKLVLFVGVLIAATQLGLNMGPLLAIIGAAGLVIGLALQGTLSNFASGLLIMIYRPFDIGDVVRAGGIIGKVEGMTLVTTLIKTPDNQTIYIPNNSLWGDVITNVTANATRRVDMTFGIGYDDDVERAREVLLDVVNNHPLVLADPEPVVQVALLNDSSVDFIVRPWANTSDYWAVFWDLTRDVKKRFDAEGISIPYPQRDVHVHHHNGEAQSDLLQPATAAANERASDGLVPSE